MELDQLVFVGFNSRVAGLDRDTGATVWSWKSPKGSGYVQILLDGDRLIVSVNGYTYCLHPLTGEQIWFNPMPGFGVGVPSLASLRGGSTSCLSQAAAADEQTQHAAAGSAAGAG